MRSLIDSLTSRLLARALPLAIIAVGPTLCFAQDAVTQAAGGTGGDPFTVSCGTKAMVGAKGVWDITFLLPLIVVFQVQPLCVSINTDGTWIGTPAAGASAGPGSQSGTASSASVVCPSGSTVSGLQGQSGIYVDRFQILCTDLGEYGHLNGTATVIEASIGGEYRIGTALFGPSMCPDNKPAKGITGRAHDWIDRIALTCAYPTVPPASIATMTVNPHNVVGGSPINGAVHLNAHSSSAGTSVGISVQTLAADAAKLPPNPVASSPVHVAGGALDGSFVFNTIPVVAPVGVTLNAESATSIVSTTFTILPASLAGLTLSPGRMTPGVSTTGTVSLNGAAPGSGVSVNLTSSVPGTATVPTTVVVAAGQTSATFPVSVASGIKAGCTVVTASGVFAPQGSPTIRQAPLAVSATANVALTLSLKGVFSGGGNATLAFSTAAKVSRLVSMSSSNPALLAVPATITVPANGTSAEFTITIPGTPPSGENCAVVTATDQAGNVSALVLSISGSGMKKIG